MSADDVAEKQGKAEAHEDSWRAKLAARRDAIKRKPGLSQAYRVGVFLLGLLFIVLGGAAVILPGPWTIPPILLGLYIWSTEFAWAHRFFERAKKQGQEAWHHAKTHPVSSAAITIAGLIGVGLAIWAVAHWDLIDRGKRAIGIGG